MAVEVKGLSYTYSESQKYALDKTDFFACDGEILGLVGSDGAGKTTLLRLLAGLLKPSAGEVSVMGLDPLKEHAAMSEQIGYMPQKFGLYEDLTVRENMNLYAALHNVPQREIATQSSELLRMTDLERFADRLTGKLSGGMKQKLGLSCAMFGSPSVLLLDEPGVGVDPLSRRELWKMVMKMKERGLCIVWATSYLDEAARCDRVCMLHEGRKIFEGKPEELLGRLEGRVIRVLPQVKSRSKALRRLQMLPETEDAIIEGNRLRCLLFRPYSSDQWKEYSEVQVVQPSFEEAYIDLLGGTHRHTVSHETKCAGDLPPRGNTVIVTENLTKKFGNFVATDALNISVRAGEIFGLLGPNGAGKTTSFRMMCGLLKPSSGKTIMMGIDLTRHARKARERIGYMAQKFSLYGTLSVRQNLDFFAGVYGLSGHLKKERITDAIEGFSLADYINSPSGSLPPGIKQRLSLACAVMHRPSFLFLDEPTSGVDPIARREFWDRINAMADCGVTVIVTTHFMDEAQYLHRMVIINRGKSIAVGSPDEIKRAGATPENPEPTMEEAFISLIEKGTPE